MNFFRHGLHLAGALTTGLVKFGMRRFFIVFLFLCAALTAPAADSAASGKVLKVLPQFLDLEGRSAISPSLYDRDAYQAILRKTPAKRSGIKFVVQWKAKKYDVEKLKLRVEMRGVINNNLQTKIIETPVKKNGWFNTWSEFKLTGEDYKKFGDLIAWRVTLWEGDTQLSSQQSFLW
jgi:hypothetical protein